MHNPRIDFSDLNALVVEDNPFMRRLLRDLLKAYGFARISDIEDAESALDLLSDGGFDIAFIDWLLPSMGRGRTDPARTRGARHGLSNHTDHHGVRSQRARARCRGA